MDEDSISVLVFSTAYAIRILFEKIDFLMEQLSVRETLQYAADLRLGSASKDERREKVERMIRELGLTNVADSPIGGSFSRGISGMCISVSPDANTTPTHLFYLY